MWRALYLSFLMLTVAAYLYWDGGDLFRSHDSDGELRRQFHIPAGIGVTKVHRTGREHCWGGGIITGEVRFTPEELRTYLEGLTDRSIWRPVALHHFSDDLRDYRFSDDALAWRTYEAEKQAMAPFYINDGNLRDAGSGQVLCYAMHVPNKDLVGTPKGTGYSGIAVVSCDAPGHADKPKAYVLGHLDSDDRLLRMRIQLTNPPQYCTKARRRPFLVD